MRVVHTQALGSRGLLVSWRLSDGGRLALLANLGDVSVASPGIPPGNLLHSTHTDLTCDLPLWSVAWVLSERG